MPDAKEVLKLLLRRQSDRKYDSRSVESDKLERILEAGRMAPSACNAQPWKFIAVTGSRLLKEIAEAASARLLGMNTFADQAPAIIVIVREKANISSRIGGSVKKKDYSLIDIGIACGNICTQAAAEGLGTCIMGWFDEKLVKRILGIPSSKRVELLITLGYSTGEYRDKKRKPAEDTISFNKY